MTAQPADTPRGPAATARPGPPAVVRQARVALPAAGAPDTLGTALRGFTLVELCVVLALAGVLASLAWPSWQGHLHQARRMDGQQALHRLQAAQEQYRSHHGLYATELGALHGAASGRSAEGHYRIELERLAAEAYRARAVALGVQRRDTACPELTLDVSLGFARHGPAARCWHR